METSNKEIRRDKVINLINSVIEKVGAQGEISREHIYDELKSLHDIIEATRSEINATRATDISGTHIPTATDELDAVVEATEVATGTIMDSCEAVTEYAENLDPAHKDFLVGEITKILEACTFQDITGQRITKVVKSLKTIDEKVNHLLEVLGDKLPTHTDATEAEDTRSGDEKLLNGPQMADKAISQDEIDKLLEDLF
ncbi:MAG TPA: protein phosphatase CheZ [Alphaproteobacteria bacterium]|nr:protein phosphatase CheZ [Alphaproteobacteria bacterium]HOO51089.1 protein phosphatase CheZ [Alphaproteobacteria bacterium]